MVRTYKRKPGARPSMYVSEEALQKAIDAVKKKTMSIRDSALKFGLKSTTLYRHIKHPNLKSSGGQPVLSKEDEYLIADRLIICADWGYPFDKFDLRLIPVETIGRKKKKIHAVPGKSLGSEDFEASTSTGGYTVSRLANAQQKQPARRTVRSQSIGDFTRTGSKNEPKHRKQPARRSARLQSRTFSIDERVEDSDDSD